MFSCPSGEKPGHGKNYDPETFAHNFTYGANSMFVTGGYSGSFYNAKFGVNCDRQRYFIMKYVLRPSDAFTILDSYLTTQKAQFHSVIRGDATAGFAARHSGKAQVAFVDGHAAALQPAEWLALRRGDTEDYQALHSTEYYFRDGSSIRIY